MLALLAAATALVAGGPPGIRLEPVARLTQPVAPPPRRPIAGASSWPSARAECA